MAIAAFPLRRLPVFDGTRRAAMHARQAAHAGVAPARTAIIRQGDIPRGADPRAQAARHAGARRPELPAPPHQEAEEQRADEVRLQPRRGAPLVQRGGGPPLPHAPDDFAEPPRRCAQLGGRHRVGIHVEARQQDVRVRHLDGKGARERYAPPGQGPPHEPVGTAAIVAADADEVHLLPVVALQRQPPDEALRQHGRSPRVDGEDEEDALRRPEAVRRPPRAQRLGDADRRPAELARQLPRHPQRVARSRKVEYHTPNSFISAKITMNRDSRRITHDLSLPLPPKSVSS